MVGEAKRRNIYIVTACIYLDTDSFDQDTVHSELFTNELKAKQFMISLLDSLFPSALLMVNSTNSLVSLLNDSQPDIIQIKDLKPNQINNAIIFDKDIIGFNYDYSNCLNTRGFIKLQAAQVNEKLQENKRKPAGSCSNQA